VAEMTKKYKNAKNIFDGGGMKWEGE